MDQSAKFSTEKSYLMLFKNIQTKSKGVGFGLPKSLLDLLKERPLKYGFYVVLQVPFFDE